MSEAQNSAEEVRTTARVFSTLASDTGSHYLPDLAFPTADITVSAARIHGWHYGRKEALEGNPGLKSEDSFVAFSHLEDASLSREEVMAKLKRVTREVREAARHSEGEATFAGAIAGKDGIGFVSIGDSHVFIVGEDTGKVEKLNLPHQEYHSESHSALLSNTVGKDAYAKPEGTPNEDHYGFLSYREIQDRVGPKARIVIASDGLLDQSHHRNSQIEAHRYRSVLQEQDQNQKLMQELIKNVGHSDAGALAANAFHAGRSDDIAVVSLAAAPGQAGFLSDGMGGGLPVGSGAATSQKAIEAATAAMLKSLAAAPEMPDAQPFHFPSPAMLEETARNALQNRIDAKTFQILDRFDGATLVLQGEGIPRLRQELAECGVQGAVVDVTSGVQELHIPPASANRLMPLLPEAIRSTIHEINYRRAGETGEFVTEYHADGALASVTRVPPGTLSSSPWSGRVQKEENATGITGP